MNVNTIKTDKDMLTFHSRRGYSNHLCGYSGSFSWIRDTNNFWQWWVIGYGQFCGSGKAVMDDFGTLVEVP